VKFSHCFSASSSSSFCLCLSNACSSVSLALPFPDSGVCTLGIADISLTNSCKVSKAFCTLGVVPGSGVLISGPVVADNIGLGVFVLGNSFILGDKFTGETNDLSASSASWSDRVYNSVLNWLSL